MAKTKQQPAPVVTPANTASADLTFAGQLTASATVEQQPKPVRHYGAKAEVLAAGTLPPALAKFAGKQYHLTAAGLVRVASSAAKAPFGGQYPAYAVLAQVALTSTSFTADQYWEAIIAAGLATTSSRPFSKAGSTISPDRPWCYLVSKHMLMETK